MTVGRSVASAWRRAGSNAASVSTRTPRAPMPARSPRNRSARAPWRCPGRFRACPGASGSSRSARCRRRRDQPRPLPNGGLELGHCHREATVPGQCHDRPIAVDKGGRDRRGERVAHAPDVGPRNVPGRRKRKWRAIHRPKLPASVATMASSGSTRRRVSTGGRDGRPVRSTWRRRPPSPLPRRTCRRRSRHAWRRPGGSRTAA